MREGFVSPSSGALFAHTMQEVEPSKLGKVGEGEIGTSSQGSPSVPVVASNLSEATSSWSDSKFNFLLRLTVSGISLRPSSLTTCK